jgi:flagellar basal body rod protein FlgC
MSIASSSAVSGMLATTSRLSAAATKIANASPAGSAPDASSASDKPETDLTTEVVNALTARASFEANALVLKTDSRMMQSLLDIKV